MAAVAGYLHRHSHRDDIYYLFDYASTDLVSCAVDIPVADMLVRPPTYCGVVVAGGEGGGGLAFDVPKKGARKASRSSANVLLGPGGGGAENPGGGPAR